MSNRSSPESEWLLVKEAAPMIGMSKHWLYGMIKAGKGPPYKVRGNKILIDKSKLLEWDRQPILKLRTKEALCSP